MASKNDITGDEIKSVPSKAYQDNYDAIFRSNRKTDTPPSDPADWKQMCDELIAEKLNLLREVHALQADAQRWRWWRERWVLSSYSEPHFLDEHVDQEISLQKERMQDGVL